MCVCGYIYNIYMCVCVCMYTHTHLPVNAIVRLPHPRDRNTQGVRTRECFNTFC